MDLKHVMHLQRSMTYCGNHLWDKNYIKLLQVESLASIKESLLPTGIHL